MWFVSLISVTTIVGVVCSHECEQQLNNSGRIVATLCVLLISDDDVLDRRGLCCTKSFAEIQQRG